MIETRQRARHEYWQRKHLNPQWADDIHFAMFPHGDANKESFQRGIDFNTTTVCHELQELASIYHLVTDLRVLDYGCGAGDFLIRMAQMVPNMQGIGIDLAESAIAHARLRASKAKLDERVRFDSGDHHILTKIVSRDQPFDIIVCRDAYYSLDKTEQKQLLESFSVLLRAGGLLYVADLAVAVESLEKVRDILIDRQSAGDPITWSTDHKRKLQFSIDEQARLAGFRLVGSPQVLEDCVADSYEMAGKLLSEPETKNIFKNIAAVARSRIGTWVCMPYVRFFFRWEEPSPTLGTDHFGLAIKKDVILGKKTILCKGEWKLPLGKWSLILGRSGVGKTTFLRLLSGFIFDRNVEFIGATPKNRYLLPQDPVLIDKLTVEENIYLFATDFGHAQHVINTLGFDPKMRARKADGRLSGGEAQRVALGQAIGSTPELLLLDEPGTGIDRIRKFQFFKEIRDDFDRRHSGPPPTVVCVDHEFVQIEDFFDYIFEIVDSRLVCVKGNGGHRGDS